MFHILLTKLLKQPKNYPFHEVFQINLVVGLYFIQTSMPGLLNSSRSGSSYVRWVAAQQPTRKECVRLGYDLRAQNRNLQKNVWNAGGGVAHLLLTCTFWIPIFTPAAGIEIVYDTAPSSFTLVEEWIYQRWALIEFAGATTNVRCRRLIHLTYPAAAIAVQSLHWSFRGEICKHDHDWWWIIACMCGKSSAMVAQQPSQALHYGSSRIYFNW